jgi:hypothetical protein
MLRATTRCPATTRCTLVSPFRGAPQTVLRSDRLTSRPYQDAEADDYVYGLTGEILRESKGEGVTLSDSISPANCTEAGSNNDAKLR